MVGYLNYSPSQGNVADSQSKPLNLRPDLQAANQAVFAAKSRYMLAKANGKRDLTFTSGYSHVGYAHDASFSVNMDIPLFDRNQGEIARTQFVINQSQAQATAASEAVLSDVADAYESVQSESEVVRLYTSGYLSAAEQSRNISQYAYQKGAASLLDLLDAERSYRATELAYRDALASYMTAVEQLRAAVGTRNLP